MRMRSRLLLVLLVVLAGACSPGSGPSPSPSPTAPAPGSPTASEPVGVRVAVVLPLDGEAPLTTAGTRTAAEAVASDHEGELGEFRLVAPDGATFVGDIATVLAEQGYDLVCLVGDTAVDVVLRVAVPFPATRFCALPGPNVASDTELPENVLVLDHRIAEAAYLGGVAAAQMPAPTRDEGDEDDEGPPPPPAGFIGDPTRPTTTRQRVAFEAGLTAGLGRGAAPRVTVSESAEEAIGAAARRHFTDGVPVLFTATGAADAAVLAAARDAGGTVVLHRDRSRFDGEVPEEVLVWFLVDVARSLDVAVDRILEGWAGGFESLGLAEGAISVHAGGDPRGAAVAERVETVAGDIREGRTTVPAP